MNAINMDLIRAAKRDGALLASATVSVVSIRPESAGKCELIAIDAIARACTEFRDDFSESNVEFYRQIALREFKDSLPAHAGSRMKH